MTVEEAWYRITDTDPGNDDAQTGAANGNNATSHYNAFMQQLGDKTAVDERMASGKNNQLRP